MTNLERKGKARKVRGQLKEAAGILSHDKKMEREGAFKRVEGAVQEGVGKAKRKVGELLTDLGDRIKE